MMQTKDTSPRLRLTIETEFTASFSPFLFVKAFRPADERSIYASFEFFTSV